MALILKTTLNTAVEAEYWRIIDANINLRKDDLTINGLVYLNKLARQNGADHIMTFSFKFPIQKTDVITVSDMYNKLKTLIEFKNALDD